MRKQTVDIVGTLVEGLIAELVVKMDGLALKGMLWKDEKNGKVRYGLNDIMFVVYRSTYWPWHETDRHKELAPVANSYFLNGMWDNVAKVEYNMLRTLPINKTIKSTVTTRSYEDVVKVLDKSYKHLL